MLKKYSDFVKEVGINVTEISIERLAAFYTETLLVIDVREVSECCEGVIPGSINIPRGILESHIFQELEKSGKPTNLPIFLICRSGMRSLLAAESLQRMGFTTVYSIRGGMKEWTDKGLPVV